MSFFETLEQKVPAKLVASVGLGLGVLTMAGCATAEAQPGPATVVRHEYTAPYTTLIPVGKVWVPQFHPADYDLIVDQCGREGDQFADERGCVELDLDVSEQVYNQYQDGAEIVLPLK